MAKYAPCPQCECDDAEKISFTWWGGLLGPAMFTHVKCLECGTTYNGSTGKSNNTAITIYVVVTLVIGLGVCVLSALANSQ